MPVTLKVKVAESGKSASIDFSGRERASEACRRINTQLCEGAISNLEDYGLLWRSPQGPTKDQWLEAGRPLGHYTFQSGDLVDFKKRMRQLRVKLGDGTQKICIVDDSLPLGDIVQRVCKRIGIANFEEYSLVLPDGEEPATSSPSLTRKVSKKEKKLEKIKQQAITEDDQWLDHAMTLRQQGIFQDRELVLKKKFFYSDQSVDKNDPVQVNVLYTQSAEAIRKGTHPCTQEEAALFAAMQIQVSYGDHNPDRHKPGFIDDLSTILPMEYVRTKGIEKKVFGEHKKLNSLPELTVKYRYVQLCRSLKTYGMTFFFVKEKVKGKNKLLPRLLGITRESVMRVDEKTKEVLKTWPLTTVRRWAASPNSFTLDFGDYSDSFYSVQTEEGDAISQLIAGYIDIVLKKQKEKQREELGGQVAGVSHIGSGPQQRALRMAGGAGQAASHGVAHGGMQAGVGAQAFRRGEMAGNLHTAQAGQISGQRPLLRAASGPQTALFSTVQSSLQIAELASGELGQIARLPQLGSDARSQKWKQNMLDVSRQNVHSRLAAITAATSAILTLTSQTPGQVSEINFTAVAASVTALSSNLKAITNDVRMVAALVGDKSKADRVLEFGRELCTASTRFLQAVGPSAKGASKMQDLLTGAAGVGTAATKLMQHAGDGDLDARAVELLTGLAKAVAAATAKLVGSAKNVAGRVDDPALQGGVITAAKATALATSQLVTCTKVVSPTISNPLCQEQVIESARTVAGAVESVVAASQSACRDKAALQALGECATGVTKALEGLINALRNGELFPKASGKYAQIADDIIGITDKLQNTMGNTAEMVRQAKLLAQSTSDLVAEIKVQAAKETDPDVKQKHILAARTLAEATQRLVEAAKAAAKRPGDSKAQEALSSAAAHLRAVVNQSSQNAIRQKVMATLERASKNTATMLAQLMSASQGAAASNRNAASQQQLLLACKAVSGHMTGFVAAIKANARNPEDSRTQLELISAAKTVLAPSQKLVSAAKSATPTVGDSAASIQLATCGKGLISALAELNKAIVRASESCGSLELETAADSVTDVRRDLETASVAASRAALLPLPGETPESTAIELAGSTKAVTFSVAQLVSAAAQGDENYTGIAARDMAKALQVLGNAVRGVAATTDDQTVRTEILSASQRVVAATAELAAAARAAVKDPGSSAFQGKLTSLAREISEALGIVLDFLPGQRDLDEALKAVQTAAGRLSSIPAAGSSTFPDTQQHLSAAAGQLSLAAADLVTRAKSGTPVEIAAASKGYLAAHMGLVQAGVTLASITPDGKDKRDLVAFLEGLTSASSKLLLAGKATAADPNAPSVKQQLDAAMRGLTTSINTLIEVCTSSAPGQKECDSAVRTIRAGESRLEAPSAPVSDNTFFGCLEEIMAKSKLLGAAMASIATHARSGDSPQFCVAVDQAAEAVTGLTDATAQAAYLIGISDPSSQAGEAGLVDQEQFTLAKDAIESACQGLLNPHSSQKNVMQAAAVIAKHTSAVCSSCKAASAATNNPVAKREFLAAAKAVATATAALVANIKVLAKQNTDRSRQACATTTAPLIDAVQGLATFASSPEFATKPAIISPEAKEAQLPLTSAGKAMVQASANLIMTAKPLIVNPKDPPMWKALANHSKGVSDAIKGLVSAVRDRAPGQAECDAAIFDIGQVNSELDNAELSATMDSLTVHEESSLQGFQEQLVEAASSLHEAAGNLGTAAKGEPEKLGHAVQAFSTYFPPLASAAIAAASRVNDKTKKLEVLVQTKTITESAMQLLYASREAGGNEKATATHPAVEEAQSNVKEAVQDLISTIAQTAAEAGVVTGQLQSIQQAMDHLDLTDSLGNSDASESFVTYQESLVPLVRDITQLSQEMMTKAIADPSQLGAVAQELTNGFVQVANDAQGAISTATNGEIAQRIQTSVKELGEACTEMVQTGGLVQSNPTDSMAKKELAIASRSVMQNVSFVLGALQAGSRGTQACINAASTIDGFVVDLETTSMFATAGTLQADGGESFAAFRAPILETAEGMVEQTKALVKAAASSQDQLADAANATLATFSTFVASLKQGATSLGADDSNAQVMLLNSAKDMAAALTDLLSSTRSASGKSVKDKSMSSLKERAKDMVTSVSSFLKTVKSVEDEALRGLRAVESAIEAIDHESSQEGSSRGSPEELLRTAAPISASTSKLMAAIASGKQADLTAAANEARTTVVDVLRIGRGAVASADDAEAKARTDKACQGCAGAMRALLGFAASGKGAAKKSQGADLSRAVAAAVTELTTAARNLKGSDWVDPSDPNVVAERELLLAAQSIEAAAKKLETLEPRSQPHIADADLPFHEQILTAAKSIAKATSSLVIAATQAQRELAQSQQSSGQSEAAYHEDAQWSSGLVSAAKLVALSTSNLCEAADATVQAGGTDEKLIASAKSVAKATAQLLVACKVKNTTGSESLERLQAAGHAVKRAADTLVKSAQKSAVAAEEVSVDVENALVAGIAQEIEAHEAILKQERELELAKRQLQRIRASKYKRGNASWGGAS